MNELRKLPVLLIAAALLTASAAAAFAAQPRTDVPKTTMFKCKDERGRVFYADKPGPECAQGDVHMLSRHGVSIEPRRTSVQAGAQAGASPAASAEQRRRDKALLSTYATEEQIDEAKQRNLALPAQALKQAEAKLERARDELSALHGQADGYASQKKQIPAALIDDVRAKETQVGRLTDETERKRAQITETEQRFDADKKRFRELTTQQAAR